MRLNLRRLIHRHFLFLQTSLLIILLIGGYFFYSRAFLVQNLTCSTSQGECPEVVLGELNALKGQNLLQFSPKSLEKKILTGDPSFISVNADVVLPKTIHLYLEIAPALVQVSNQDQKQAIVITKSLKASKHIATLDPHLPLIITDQAHTLRLLEPVTDPSLLSALDLAVQLNNQFISFNYVELVNQQLKAFLPPSITVFFNPNDFPRQIARLQLTLNQLELDTVESIDVRLSKPVVAFSHR